MYRDQFPNLGFGLGLREPHYREVLHRETSSQWFEVISEQYMGIRSRPLGSSLDFLLKVREQYPIVCHGVSMSIGGTDPLCNDYFSRLKKLISLVKPAWVSDHLCWVGVHGQNNLDLFPLPYNEESLKHLIGRVKEAQDRLEQPLLIENASTYVEFNDSNLGEAEFLGTLAREAGCGLLLDVNNIFVSCFNHGWDWKEYVKKIPFDHVVQIHLAGPDDQGGFWVDTHDHPVLPEVWEIYQTVVQKTGPVSTMIEWDDHIPPLKELESELQKAKNLATAVLNAPSTLNAALKESVCV